MKSRLLIFYLCFIFPISCLGQKLVVDSIPGKVKTYYPPGRVNRAKATQQLIQNAVTFYEKKFPGNPFTITMYVLDKVVVPYYDDSARSLIVGVNVHQMPIARLLQATATSPADTVDLVAVHELGHYFLITLNNAHIPAKWADEFFATYFAVCYLETKKGLRMLPSASPDTLPKYRTLADFERLYYGVWGPNYGWYQDQFAKLAYALYPKFKTDLIKIAIEQYRLGGLQTPPLELLQTLAPKEMANWLNEMK